SSENGRSSEKAITSSKCRTSITSTRLSVDQSSNGGVFEKKRRSDVQKSRGRSRMSLTLPLRYESSTGLKSKGRTTFLNCLKRFLTSSTTGMHGIVKD